MDYSLISTCNHMFRRAIWDNLPSPLFNIFQKSRDRFISKTPEIKKKKKKKLLLVNHAKCEQLQNNTVKGVMSIAINRAVKNIILFCFLTFLGK